MFRIVRDIGLILKSKVFVALFQKSKAALSSLGFKVAEDLDVIIRA